MDFIKKKFERINYRKKFYCKNCKEYSLYIYSDNQVYCTNEDENCNIDNINQIESIVERNDFKGYFLAEEIYIFDKKYPFQYTISLKEVVGNESIINEIEKVDCEIDNLLDDYWITNINSTESIKRALNIFENIKSYLEKAFFECVILSEFDDFDWYKVPINYSFKISAHFYIRNITFYLNTAFEYLFNVDYLGVKPNKEKDGKMFLESLDLNEAKHFLSVQYQEDISLETFIKRYIDCILKLNKFLKYKIELVLEGEKEINDIKLERKGKKLLLKAIIEQEVITPHKNLEGLTKLVVDYKIKLIKERKKDEIKKSYVVIDILELIDEVNRAMIQFVKVCKGDIHNRDITTVMNQEYLLDICFFKISEIYDRIAKVLTGHSKGYFSGLTISDFINNGLNEEVAEKIIVDNKRYQAFRNIEIHILSTERLYANLAYEQFKFKKDMIDLHLGNILYLKDAIIKYIDKEFNF